MPKITEMILGTMNGELSFTGILANYTSILHHSAAAFDLTTFSHMFCCTASALFASCNPSSRCHENVFSKHVNNGNRADKTKQEIKTRST